MNKRKLGRTELRVSEIGLGCWQLGGDFGPIDDAQAETVISAALSECINFYDTADVYGAGRSESYLGKVLSSNKDEVIVATKYGRAPGTYPDGYSLTNMRDSVLRAQDRLQRDVIDLLQLHCVPTALLQHGEIFDWLRSLQQEGLIRYFGASVETLDEAFICSEQYGLASLQIIFNLFRQNPIEHLFDKVKDKGIGIIVRLPLASGLLSGKFSTSTKFDKTDHRNFNKDGEAFNVGETFSGVPFEKGLELVTLLEEFKPKELSMLQFALRWILDHDAVSTVIAGASSKEQVAMNAAVSELPNIDLNLHDKLFAFYKETIEKSIRGKY